MGIPPSRTFLNSVLSVFPLDLFGHHGFGLRIHALVFIVDIDLGLPVVELVAQVFAVKLVGAGHRDGGDEIDGHTLFFHVLLGRDQHLAGSVLLEGEGHGNALAVFVVENGAPLFAHQVLGVYGQGCDEHQQEGENNLLYS